jgi:hypothetical protein
MQEKLDTLIGARAIAAFTGLTRSQIYHQHKSGALPLVQQGSMLIGSKARLTEHFRAERVPIAASAADAPSVERKAKKSKKAKVSAKPNPERPAATSVSTQGVEA